jgi:hypothetical protein
MLRALGSATGRITLTNNCSIMNPTRRNLFDTVRALFDCLTHAEGQRTVESFADPGRDGHTG